MRCDICHQDRRQLHEVRWRSYSERTGLKVGTLVCKACRKRWVLHSSFANQRKARSAKRQERVEQALQMREAGVPVLHIAEELGVHPNTVYLYLDAGNHQTNGKRPPSQG